MVTERTASRKTPGVAPGTTLPRKQWLTLGLSPEVRQSIMKRI